MRPISVKIPEALDRRLTELARKRGVSRSALVRQAIENLDKDSPKSFAAAAADLAGRLRGGPRDLSSNPRHMRGYGK